LPDDASIGVLFVGFLALAVVVMSAQRGRGSGDLTRFLFGSINAVDSTDLRILLVVTALALLTVVLLHRALLVSTFDAVQARLLGFRPQLTHFVLLVLLALAIVASFRTVGSLLVFAFLVAPPAAASLFVRRVSWMMACAAAIGATSALLGLLISYHHDTATGATMALVTVVAFMVAMVIRNASSSHVRARLVWPRRSASGHAT
jgi:ABC-type Mn2+/Zn2+ transport system permease subunit